MYQGCQSTQRRRQTGHLPTCTPTPPHPPSLLGTPKRSLLSCLLFLLFFGKKVCLIRKLSHPFLSSPPPLSLLHPLFMAASPETAKDPGETALPPSLFFFLFKGTKRTDRQARPCLPRLHPTTDLGPPQTHRAEKRKAVLFTHTSPQRGGGGISLSLCNFGCGDGENPANPSSSSSPPFLPLASSSFPRLTLLGGGLLAMEVREWDDGSAASQLVVAAGGEKRG